MVGTFFASWRFDVHAVALGLGPRRLFINVLAYFGIVAVALNLRMSGSDENRGVS